jgi:hypothetical protein
MISMRAIIDRRRGFDRTEHYYRMFSWDVSYNAENILIEPRKITRVAFRSIADLLRAILRYGRDGENRFLIVSHGNPEGLPIRIAAGNTATLNSNIMQDLSEALGGSAQARRNARENIMSYGDDHGRRVFQNTGQMDELLGLIQDVRRMQIEHIEFRGCSIGAGPALRAVHRLLGSHLTAAPRVQFIWSRLRTAGVHGTPQWLRERVSQMSPVRRQFTWVDCLRSPGGSASANETVFALAVTGQGDDQGFQLNALNVDVIQGWSQSYLQPLVYFAGGQQPPGGGYRRGGFLPFIAFSTPNDAQYPFVFPGDGFRYTAQLAYEIGPPR